MVNKNSQEIDSTKAVEQRCSKILYKDPKNACMTESFFTTVA